MLALLAGVRWSRVVWIGIAGAAVLAAVSGTSYMKGSLDTTVRLKKAHEAELEAQRVQMLAQSARERELAVQSLEARHEAALRIRNVRRPAGGCDLTPDCVRWYDDTVRAAGDSAGTGGGFTAAGDGQ